jgi:membrane-bound serine protease (ClpP class)
MLHKVLVGFSVLLLVIVLNVVMGAASVDGLAHWMQTYSGSIVSLAVAMLTLIPALLTLGSGTVEGISALSFVLFFWGRFQANHDAIPLVLFLVGLTFVAIEVLLVPGLGKPFLLGAICLSGAIYKAYPDHGQGLQALMFAYAALGGGLWLALKVIPRSRWTSRFMALKPPTPEESRFDPGAELQSYVGKRGKSLTALRPSGKAIIDGRTLGVRSDGTFLPAHAALQVVRVESNQLIVELSNENGEEQ